MTEANHAEDLIAEIAMQCDGIGNSKAFALAEYFSGDLQAFLQADVKKLLQLKKSNGKAVLLPIQADKLVACKASFPAGMSIQESWVFNIGREFLCTQVQHLQGLALTSLDINPFLVKVLDLKTPKQVVEFNLFQNVTRSIVTSWGMTVEKLLVRSGAEAYVRTKGARSGRSPDIMFEKSGKKYLIQVKSGPNTMNIDMVQSLNEIIANFKIEQPSVKFLLGMTYGRKEMISTQIRGTLQDFDDSILIGRELWDLVSGKSDYHKELFLLLDAASHGVMTATFSELLHQQLDLLVAEWDRTYDGLPMNQVLENFL